MGHAATVHDAAKSEPLARPMGSCFRRHGNVAAWCSARRSPSIPAIGAALAAATLFASPSALAEEIRISGRDCTSGVHLVARDAHFSAVLKQLAQVLDFQLSFESESDPLVNVDAAMRPGDLLARLVPDANISATQASDPRCPHQKRILKLWVLPKVQENHSPNALFPPQIPPPQEQHEPEG
jgi:hypothetical protein